VIDSIARLTDTVLLWTHYFDDQALRARKLRHKFADRPVVQTHGGVSIELWEQHYLEALEWGGFCGGAERTSLWLTRRGLCDLLTRHGFEIRFGFEEPDHPNGPAFCLLARRKPG
jgi:hypothetical protein